MADVGDLVNRILGRGKPSSEVSPQKPVTQGPETQYVTASAPRKLEADQKLRAMLPAPVGSEAYARKPKITYARDVKQQVWTATASFTLRQDSELPAQPTGSDISRRVSGSPSKAQPSARAVLGRATGYTPSPVEGALRNSPLRNREYR